MKRTVALLILDGWGIGQNDVTNAIYAANPKTIADLARRYPSGALLAHGIAVGLPWGEAGTDEAGHLTIGAGRTVYQALPRITLAVRDASFFANPVLTAAVRHAARAKGTLHLVGSLCGKNAHSSPDHLHALVALAEREGVPRVRIHLVTGSKDSAPRAAATLMKKIPWSATVKIASLMGRYYAVDGGAERAAAACKAVLGLGARTDDPEAYLHGFYLHGLDDEFVEPAAVGPDPRSVEENDAVIFFDFDARPLAELARVVAGSTDAPKNMRVITLGDAGLGEAVPAAFADDRPETTLGKVLAENGRTQFRIAETCRYPHVTHFMNGLADAAFENEYRILVPGENVARKEERPEMMMKEVADRGIAAIEEGADFVVMNFAAPDVMAHTGSFEAAKAAVLAADRELGNVAKAVLARGGALVITSDHGNAERMRDPVTGAPETDHNANPVPVIVVAVELEKPAGSGVPSYEGTAGLLSDIAPTVLALMGIATPQGMAGSNLVGRLA